MYERLEKIINMYDVQPHGHELSTSTHYINGDNTQLNNSETMLYMLLNYMNNVDDADLTNIDKNLLERIDIKNFQVHKDLLDKIWSKFDKKSSPSRKVGDMFWSLLPYEELGDLRALDIGCGSGRYSEKIWKWSDKNLKSYTGLDVYPNKEWEKMKSWGLENSVQVDFHKTNIDLENLLDFIPNKTNFFMSQSAIEHIKYDLKYFQSIQKYIESVNFPVYQVHLFPASESLRLFLLHGYRQYGLNSIVKITKIFKDSSIELVKLCGAACNELHYEFITDPVYISRTGDMRETKTKEYDEKLYEAILKDSKEENHSPAFWALVIKNEN
jgi:SAM-dependent methyltransferase